MSERPSTRSTIEPTGFTGHTAGPASGAPAAGASRRRGLTVERHFTAAGADPFASVAWSRRTSRIANPDGSVVFEMKDAEVPTAWSQVAADIMVSKYFRKAGVPEVDAEGTPLLDDDGRQVTGPERSAKQVVSRLAGTWRWWGDRHGYFATPDDAQVFEDELKHMLVHQMAAPNSPQWFNTGLAHAYGITGPAQGHFATDPRTGEMTDAHDAYTRPQVSACFIQSVEDDLVGEGGIMDLWVREARLFKFGSGTGTNYSAIRGEGERLSGGGTSSGLMSFLKVGDRAAGAIKSGGTTRRAAKMVCLNVDHPDIERFISWKADEEKKVAALIAAGYPADYNGEAYATVSGQNANNTVRVTNDFVKAVEDDADWNLTRRTDGSIHKTVKARDLWRQIAEAAWACADPGLHYDTTINEWHTSPESGRINASNPCSEYLFLDNTACNLASLNLIKFVDVESGQVDIAAYRHAIRLWTVVLEISVMMAGYPSEEIARRSFDFRTLGLGYANIGTVLMIRGLPYDSDEARAFTGAMTAIMTGESYATSAEMAKHLGPFASYAANERHMLRVIRNHRRAAYDAPVTEYEGLSVPPMGLNPELAPVDLIQAAREAWDRALAGGELFGYRNAQTTLLAPTGTIGLLMDCDTTGVEPDFALVKFKKLAGGGYFKIANQSIPPALKNLGYSQDEIAAIMTYVLGTLRLDGAPHVNRETLTAKGLTAEDLAKVEAALPSVFELGFAFNAWTLGEEALARVGVSMADASAPGFDLLRTLGFTRDQVAQANEHICGTMTVEGSPALKPEHLPVFDTANKCGTRGTRFIHHMGHIQMMSIAQSFLSGAISKTINMPNEATVEDIVDAYMESWSHGIKAMALYRDGSKMSQPLSTKSGAGDDEGLSETEVDELVAIAVADAVAAATRDAEAEIAAAKQAAEEAQLAAKTASEDAIIAAKTAQDEAIAAAVATAVEEARALWEADLIDDAEAITAELAPTPGVDVAPALRGRPSPVMSSAVETSPPSAGLPGATDVGARFIAPAPATVALTEPAATPITYAPAPAAVSSADDLNRAHRRRLPGKRRGFTQEGRVAGQKVFLRTGEYEDGTLGEVFIDVAKEGAAFRSMINCFAISISKGLQYGVPLEEYVDTFTFVRFEPQGMVTGHPNIRMATSMIDYVFRVLAFEYLGRNDLVQVAPELTAPPEEDSAEPTPAPTHNASAALFPHWDGPKRAPSANDAPATTSPDGAAGVPARLSPSVLSSAVETSPPSGTAADATTTATTASVGEPLSGSPQGATPAVDQIGTATALVEEATEHDARVLPQRAAMEQPQESVPVVTIVHDIPRSPLPGGGGNGHANGSVNGNGHHHNGNGHAAYAAPAPRAQAQPTATHAPSALDASLGHLMGDAPFCDVCGHITVRNGACYKCLNCGNSLGCS